MAIGNRIRFFRKRKGMKQKELGEALGFTLKTSEVRMTQYESEARTPKEDMIRQMAYFFNVSPAALKVPDIDTYIGLMHTLFALEDMYGLTVENIDGCTCLRLKPNPEIGREFVNVGEMLDAWQKQAALYREEKITKEDYDDWRYNYPAKDSSGKWAHVISQELSDMLAEEMKNGK